MVEQTLNERYKPLLWDFMVQMNGQQYYAEYKCSQEELLAITPDAVARYVKLKA